MRARRSEAQWRKTVAAFEASGEKVTAFCARRDINAGTLGWWRSRLRGERAGGGGRSGLELVAVDVMGPAAKSAAEIAIVVGDAEVRFTTQADVEYVVALVGALRARC